MTFKTSRKFWRNIFLIENALILMIIVVFAVLFQSSDTIPLSENYSVNKNTFLAAIGSMIIIPILSAAVYKIIENSLGFNKQVNDEFKQEIEKLGSIFFTGIDKQIFSKQIFDRVPKPIDFAVNGTAHSKSKFMFLGISTELIPNWIIDQIPEGVEEYQFLYSNNSEISKMRFDSILDSKITDEERAKKGYETAEDYVEKNIEGLKGLKEAIQSTDKISFRSHTVIPFGLFIAHGNYIWYTPLWNHKDPRTSTYVLQIYRDSSLGNELTESFDAVWHQAERVNTI